ncbi:MAG: DNA internalization-related competence protein ComEC/Rec2, partial [Dokdonella sp.]
MDSRGPAITPLAALAVLAGVLAVQALPVLPPAWFTAGFAIVAFCVLQLARPRAADVDGSEFPTSCPRAEAWCRYLAIIALACAWAALRGQWALDARLPSDVEGRDFDVIGLVAELPQRRDDASRFMLRIESASLAGQPIRLRGLARLSWYGDDVPEIAPCSRWQLRLRLKRPRGLVNPVGFDFERYALERGIVATGYVREPAIAVEMPRPVVCVDRWRDRIARGIASAVSNPHDAHLLQALAVGDTRGLTPGDWDVARANGVTHLLSISGFHVGVAALFGAWLARFLWWLLPRLAMRWPRPLGEAGAALLTAIAYGALAGNSLPTMRTVLMIGVFALTRATRRNGSVVQSLALAALAVLLVDPLSVLGAGFWLSFVGVAFLMLGLQRPRDVIGHVRALGSAQMVMTLALFPLSFWFFGQASLLGGLANLIAVPLISLAIVPLALLSAVLLLIWAPLATPLLWIASWLGHAQWWLWMTMSTWPGAHWTLPEVTPFALVLATIGAAWIFLPRGLPLRWLGFVLFLPLLFPNLHRPQKGGFDALFVDVGQGLSVLVRTRDHAMLYDAGARFPSGFDLGTAAVLPSLQGLGIDSLDLAIVSHADNDHAGGMPAVLATWPQAMLVGGEPERGDITLQPCRRGQSWRWDDVSVRVIRPDVQDSAGSSSNDHSCVVMVEGQGARLLLTGDISSRLESAVAATIDPNDPRPLLLSVPHHGSNRSSAKAFIASLHPALAVVSAAWLSRFGHPHPAVVKRYADAGV